MTIYNTINICIGHLPFPNEFFQYVDLMITPKYFYASYPRVIINDCDYGSEHGDLSEYAQLIWLYDNYEKVVDKKTFVRLFQYRRFVSPYEFGNLCSHSWAKRIEVEGLKDCQSIFERQASMELFNRPLSLPETVRGQYADCSVEEDIINFASFLKINGKMTDCEEIKFLTSTTLIPAANMGIFHRDHLYWLLAELKEASSFMLSKFYVKRSGYQRRVMGFLLERYNSFLLLHKRKQDMKPFFHGYHIILSKNHDVDRTINL
jgi:hypothetical protein